VDSKGPSRQMGVLTWAVLTANNGTRRATDGDCLDELQGTVIRGNIPYINCAPSECRAQHDSLVLVELQKCDSG
jgi:hypothetical protein